MLIQAGSDTQLRAVITADIAVLERWAAEEKARKVNNLSPAEKMDAALKEANDIIAKMKAGV